MFRPQIPEPSSEPAAEFVRPDPEFFEVGVGDLVELVARRSGLGIVSVMHLRRLIRTPSPTKARVVEAPHPTVNGVPHCRVRLLDGPHRGKIAGCYPGVLRRVGSWVDFERNVEI